MPTNFKSRKFIVVVWVPLFGWNQFSASKTYIVCGFWKYKYLDLQRNNGFKVVLYRTAKWVLDQNLAAYAASRELGLYIIRTFTVVTYKTNQPNILRTLTAINRQPLPKDLYKETHSPVGEISFQAKLV